MEGTHGKDHQYENNWEHMVETDVVEGPVEKVACNEIVEAIQSMKSGKATGTSEVSVEMIVASIKIEVKVMMELCQRVWMVEKCLMSGKLLLLCLSLKVRVM